MKGIGLVWWPILVVCITGFFTGIQTARGADRSVISLSWWGLGVSAALHLFSGKIVRENNGSPQERKRIFDVTQKANSRFVLTMGVMCVFLGALRGGHGPLSEPTRVAGIVLAVASVLGFVLFLREGLSVPKFKHTYNSVRQEMDYEKRKKAIPKLRAAQNEQANRIRTFRDVTAARRIQRRFRERPARGGAQPQFQQSDSQNVVVFNNGLEVRPTGYILDGNEVMWQNLRPQIGPTTNPVERRRKQIEKYKAFLHALSHSLQSNGSFKDARRKLESTPRLKFIVPIIDSFPHDVKK
jgi:hypothetical protein